MAFQAQFVRGDNVLVRNYTPVADVNAGDVVVIGDEVLIATQDIPANTLGGLNVSGGTYLVTGDAAIADGVILFWDNTAKKVTANAAAGVNKYFGHAIEACTGNNDTFEATHRDPKT
jgi:predicted RecA/RadA family phage recombinase